MVYAERRRRPVQPLSADSLLRRPVGPARTPDRRQRPARHRRRRHRRPRGLDAHAAARARSSRSSTPAWRRRTPTSRASSPATPASAARGRETNGVDDDHNGYVDDWQGWDFVNNDNTVETQGLPHGTHVSGTIAALANNDVGVAGVAPGGEGHPGQGLRRAQRLARLVHARAGLRLRRAARRPGRQRLARRDGQLARSSPTRSTRIPNTLYVVAAGNSGADASTTYPCNTPPPPTSSASARPTTATTPPSFSNYSATYVDLFAPGVDIASTFPGSDYSYMDGTSMATPHVAGVAALLVARESRRDERPAQGRAAGLGRRARHADRTVGHRRPPERQRGDRRAAGAPRRPRRARHRPRARPRRPRRRSPRRRRRPYRRSPRPPRRRPR